MDTVVNGEIWAKADHLIKRLGDEAPAYAAHHARELLDVGETERRLYWLRVMVASKALLVRDSAA